MSSALKMSGDFDFKLWSFDNKSILTKATLLPGSHGTVTIFDLIDDLTKYFDQRDDLVAN